MLARNIYVVGLDLDWKDKIELISTTYEWIHTFKYIVLKYTTDINVSKYILMKFRHEMGIGVNKK